MDERSERDALESIRIIAKMARVFYDEAVAQGFAPQEALALTHSWVRGVIQARAS